MPKVTSLGHVGIFVTDLERSIAFYRDMLGLKVSDRSERNAFMTAQDRVSEHHEFVLFTGRAEGAASTVQQISFHASSLQDVRDFYKTFVEHDVRINRVVSHGNAIGCYFQDPDGNNIEVYYGTGIDWPQPFGVPVDLLNDSDDEILNAHLTKKFVPA